MNHQILHFNCYQDDSTLGKGFCFSILLALVSSSKTSVPVLQQVHLLMSVPYFSSILIATGTVTFGGASPSPILALIAFILLCLSLFFKKPACLIFTNRFAECAIQNALKILHGIATWILLCCRRHNLYT